MRVWPGRPYPLGATWDGAGVNFALFSEHATKVELCLFDSADATKESAPDPTARADRPGLARLPARRRARASSTATASTARTTRRTATASTRTRSCSTRTPRRSAATCGGTTRCSATRSGTDDLSFDDRDSAAFAPLAAVIDTAFTWGDDRPPRTPWHKTLIYEVHVKGFTKLHPDVPEKLRGTYAGLAPSRSSSTCTTWRHRGRAAAGPPPPQRPAPGREGADELLGLQHARLLRPAGALRRRGQPARRRAGVQDDGPGAARGRHRGDPRRGLQPHGRGQPDGPDAVVARHRQRQLLPPLAGGPAVLHGLHRLRQHAQHAAPARAAADHGQPAVLGDGDARRRVPLRPGQHARPRAVRGEQARRVLRHHPPGPGAHRR